MMNIGDNMDNELKQRLHEYAEGSPQLESFLHTCVFRGIDTIACCAGHEDGKDPYVFLEYREDYEERTKDFIHYILSETLKDDLGISISYIKQKDSVGVSFRFPSREVSDVFYTVFSGIRLPHHVPIPENLEAFSRVGDGLEKNELSSRLDIVDGKEYLFIYKDHVALTYDTEQTPMLEEYMDYVKQTSRLLPNLVCSCDVASLKQFSSVLKGEVDTKSK